ncbi:2Fe-2S ferredoxin [Verrucomicrobia bacterium LW23]|nr:2Fe-2S ferredoxin [Verrucomicrobia bacterium LW23]
MSNTASPSATATPTPAAASAEAAAVEKNWTEVARLDSLQPGVPKIILVAGKSIGLIRDKNQVHALLNYCPHAGAPVCTKARVSGFVGTDSDGNLTYNEETKVLRCPWHHWEFYLATGLPVVKTRGRLKRFDVRVREGVVELVM